MREAGREVPRPSRPMCKISCNCRIWGAGRLPSPAALTIRSRRLPALTVLIGLGTLAAGPSQLASGQAGIESQRRAAEALRGQIAAENERLAQTRDGLAVAQRRLASLVTRVRAREARLAGAQSRLIGARIHLSKLERREAVARRTLARNLVAQYESPQPQLVNVVLSS